MNNLYNVYMLSDVNGNTTIKIYKNDKVLNQDIENLYENEGIDFQLFVCDEDYVINKVTDLVKEYGVSVIDMSGRFFDMDYLSCDNFLKRMGVY